MWIKVVQLSSPDGPMSHVEGIKTPGFKTRLVLDQLVEMNENATVSALKPLIIEKFKTLSKKPSLIQVYELSEDDSRVGTKPSDVLKAGVNYGFVDLSLPKQDQEQVKDRNVYQFEVQKQEQQDQEQQGRSWKNLWNAACERWQVTFERVMPGVEGYTKSFIVGYKKDMCMLHLGLPGVGASMLTDFRAQLEENPSVPAGALVSFHKFGNDGVAMLSHTMFTDKPTKFVSLGDPDYEKAKALQREGRGW